MFRAAVGLSTDHSAEAAAEAAAREALDALGETASFGLCFVTPHHRPRCGAALRAVRRLSGVDRLIGCSAGGVIAGEREVEGEPAFAVCLAAADESSLVPFFLQGLGNDGAAAGAAFADRLQSHVSASTTAVILPDPFGFAPREFFETVERTLGFHPMVGGAASGGEGNRKTFQICSTEVDSHALAGFLIDGGLSVRHARTQGCTPIGEPLTITKAKENIIVEIGGRPALDRLRESLGSLEMPEPKNLAGSVFAGIAIDPSKEALDRGDYLVRSILGVDPRDGRVAVADLVRPGQTIQFQLHDGVSAEEDLRAMLSSVSPAAGAPAPRLGLYFNCAGRGRRLFSTPDHDARIIREVLGPVPLIGFFGSAEFAPVGARNLMHHYTGVLVLVGGD